MADEPLSNPEQFAPDPTPRPYLSFDHMTWPNPLDPRDVEWTLRYGTPTPQQRQIAASMIAAYKQLVTDSRRERDSKIAGIRKAMKEPTSD